MRAILSLLVAVAALAQTAPQKQASSPAQQPASPAPKASVSPQKIANPTATVAPAAKRCEALLGAKEPDQAEKCYRAAIAANPANPTLHKALTDLLMSRGNILSAETEFRILARLAPDESSYAVAFLNFLGSQKLTDKLAELLPSYEEKWPQVADFAALHGWLFVQKGEFDPAQVYYRKAASLAPALAGEYYSQFARSLIETGRNEEAIRVIRGRMAIAPASQAQHSELAHLLETRKLWGEAQAEYVAADGPAGISAIGSETMSFAMRMERIGELDAAISAYASLAKSSGPGFTAPFHLMSLLETQQHWDQLASLCAEMNGNASCQVLIKQLSDKGQVDGALKLYRAMLTPAQPFGLDQFSGVRVYRSDVLKSLGTAKRWDDAATLCASPSDFDCGRLLKDMFESGNVDAAVAFARKLTEKEANQGSALWLLSIDKSLSLDARIALSVESAKVGRSTYNIESLLKTLRDEGNLKKAAEALRRVAPGFEVEAKDLLTSGDIFYRLAYQGYLTTVVSTGFQLEDRRCLASGPFVSVGEVVRMAYFQPVSCGPLPHVVLNYGGQTWGGMQSNIKFVVAPATADIREIPDVTLQQVTAGIPLNGAAPSASAQNQVVDEVTLGINARTSLLSSRAVYDDPGASAVGSHAFQMLMQTSIARSGNVPSFQLTLLNDTSVNAFSTAGGQIYVNKGMLPFVRDNEGMWAAVIGHEVGHVVAHHQYKQYVRVMSLKLTQELLRQQAAVGNKAAQWAWLFSLSGGRMLNMKLNRNDELEADRMGMMMMAEAGYHPDYIMALMQRLHGTTGEKGKVSAFLSADHPRWETREKKIKAAYADALNLFNSRWPDASTSPGGVPPKQ